MFGFEYLHGNNRDITQHCAQEAAGSYDEDFFQVDAHNSRSRNHQRKEVKGGLHRRIGYYPSISSNLGVFINPLRAEIRQLIFWWSKRNDYCN
jgi:hypothetical protein